MNKALNLLVHFQFCENNIKKQAITVRAGIWDRSGMDSSEGSALLFMHNLSAVVMRYFTNK